MYRISIFEKLSDISTLGIDKNGQKKEGFSSNKNELNGPIFLTKKEISLMSFAVLETVVDLTQGENYVH